MKKGIYTALVTPFDKTGNIDYCALKRIIDNQIEANVAGVIALGTTAETPTLTNVEKKELLNFVLQQTNGKIEVWVGCGSNSTAETLKEIEDLNNCGANGYLLSLPAYNKPNFSGLKKHVELCCLASKKPIMLYYVPSRTGLVLSAAQLSTLCNNSKIVALKEASGNLNLFYYMANYNNLLVFSGNDPESLQSLMLGGSGIVSVASNAYPKQMVELCNLFFANKKEDATQLYSSLSPVLDAMFIETNPVPIKFILEALGVCSSVVRLPLGELNDNSKTTIDQIIEKNIS